MEMLSPLLCILLVAVFLDETARILSPYLFPRVLFKVPAGLTADSSAMWGLLGLMANANAYSITPQASLATSGTNITLTASQVTNGPVLLTSGASGGFTITLPATTALLTALGPTIPVDGTYAQFLFVQNNNIGQTGTLTAGDSSTTLSGTMTIATNTTRAFLLSITNGTSITITNIGSLTL